MLNIRTVGTKKRSSLQILQKSEKASIFYHNLFDFPMNFADLVRWQVGKKNTFLLKDGMNISSKNEYYYLEGCDGLVYKRTLRKRISDKKLKIANKASKIISLIPTVKMIAVTGSLAMENSSDESDIDLIIITKSGQLWTTRLLVYLSFVICHLSFRRPIDSNQKDKLCLNMWLDESDLIWRERNIYTAHEIAQIIPLVNKDKIYEKFLSKNKWVLDYWPNAVKIRNPKYEVRNKLKFPRFKYLNVVSNFVFRTSNLIAFKIQYLYMKNKISKEKISLTRALFHPQDWGKVVLSRLSS